VAEFAGEGYEGFDVGADAAGFDRADEALRAAKALGELGLGHALRAAEAGELADDAVERADLFVALDDVWELLSEEILQPRIEFDVVRVAV
jgi:hypothetical protein